MGYADDLYNIENAVGGLKNNRGELVAIFVKKGNSFGLLEKDQGRRIAMNSRTHTNVIVGKSITEELEGEPFYTTIRSRPRLEYEAFSPDHEDKFRQLLASHQDLNPADNLVYMGALHDYSEDFKHPSMNPYEYFNAEELEDYKAAAIAKAAHYYLQATRPLTPEDMELAKAEYAEVVSNLGVPGYQIPHDSSLHLRQAASIEEQYGGFMLSSVEPEPYINQDTGEELPVAKRIEEALEKRSAAILNKPSNPPTWGTTIKRTFGL